MERLLRVLSFACVFPLFVACGDPPTGGDEDASMPDSATDTDGATTDPDASVPDPDASVPDAGPPNPMVRFVVPSVNVLESSAPVPLRVVANALVDRVDIVLDGSVIANLAVPYEFSLVTADLALGEHVLIPRALIGAVVFEGPAITVTIERTPSVFEEIVSETENGLLPARTPIHIVFDEALAASSRDTITVAVQNSGVAAPGVLTVEDDTIVFTPTRPWLEGKPVSVTVSGPVEDLYGNVAAVAEYKSFTVRSYWEQSVDIGTDSSVSFPGTGDSLIVGIQRYPANNPVGQIRLRGRVDGIELVAPTLDGDFDNVRFVDGGVDAQGVAYVVYEAVDAATNGRALVVARRDPATALWTKETIVPIELAGTISNRSFHVTAGGHAFLRYYISPAYVTYHRGPNDAAFTVTSAYGDFALDDTTAFPGNAGRSCRLRATYVVPVTHEIVCENGGLPTNTLAIVPTSEISSTPMMRASATGDAVLSVAGSLYVFDGATETLSAPTTESSNSFGYPTRVAISPLGHACGVAITFGAQGGVPGHLVFERAPGGAFGAPTFLADADGYIPSVPTGVAVDDEGHCFIDFGRSIIHDATFDGQWSVPFAYSGNQSPTQIFAGAANQALRVPSTSLSTAYFYNPLP